MKGILIVGGSGLIGQTLVAHLDEAGYEVAITTRSGESDLPVRSVQLNLESREDIRRVVQSEAPVIIINAAAQNGYAACSTHPLLAQQVNVKGVDRLLDEASALPSNPLFVQLSSEAVFDGEKGNYTEQDLPNATTRYGKTKAEADALVAQYPSHLIARTALAYGSYKFSKRDPRFVHVVREALGQGEEFVSLSDTLNTPIFLDDLCTGIIHLVNGDHKGLFHMGGDELVSKYDFAKEIAHQFGLDDTTIVPKKRSSYDRFGDYPANTSLDSSKLHQTGFKPRGITEGLKAYREQEKV